MKPKPVKPDTVERMLSLANHHNRRTALKATHAYEYAAQEQKRQLDPRPTPEGEEAAKAIRRLFRREAGKAVGYVRWHYCSLVLDHVTYTWSWACKVAVMVGRQELVVTFAPRCNEDVMAEAWKVGGLAVEMRRCWEVSSQEGKEGIGG